MTIYPLLNTKVNYRWDRNFTPLALVGASSTIYAISGKSPAKTVAEFVDLANKNESFNYATQGTGTSGHLLMEAFRIQTGSKLAHIPYKGISPAIMAVISGESQVLSSSLASTAPFVASGQLKLIGTTRPQRYPNMPDVPTMAELGYPNLTLETWFGTFAPAGIPPDVRERLILMLSKAIESPEFKDQAEKYGLEIKHVVGDSFGKLVAKDTAFWKEIIDKANVKLD
jgi:tripartite-type tricarboxylate transporter receptor subunit TctC